MQESGLSPVKLDYNIDHPSTFKGNEENYLSSTPDTFNLKRANETAFSQDCLQLWDFVKHSSSTAFDS